MSDAKRKPNDLKAQLAGLGYDGTDKKQQPKKTREELEGEVRRAVEKLNKRPLKTAPTPSPSQQEPSRPQAAGKELLYRRDLPREAPRRVHRRRNAPKVVLESTVAGLTVASVGSSHCLDIAERADEVEEVEPVSADFERILSTQRSGMRYHLKALTDPAALSPDDFIFMDVESTGLSNSPLFLIGVMVWKDGGFEARQFFARNYAEERAVISLFLDLCATKKVLVTFNGKSFDFPFIRARAAATGIPFAIDPLHLDMLHVCRRIWKRRLPDCKLQTLETFICDRPRYGDIPGAEIPDAYHAYVRTDDAWQMVQVLKHNMLDLITMADLMNRFPQPRQG